MMKNEHDTLRGLLAAPNLAVFLALSARPIEFMRAITNAIEAEQKKEELGELDGDLFSLNMNQQIAGSGYQISIFAGPKCRRIHGALANVPTAAAIALIVLNACIVVGDGNIAEQWIRRILDNLERSADAEEIAMEIDAARKRRAARAHGESEFKRRAKSL